LSFTDGQAAAAELILATRDGIVGVQGYAGTGKTTALRSVRHLAENAGFEVRGFAPSAAAALVLEQEAGIKSQTLASLFIEQARSSAPTPAPSLWIVDEASMLGNREAHRLLEAAQRANARLVLVGDVDQLPSVEAGAPFRLLVERGMAFATMDEIMRQKDPTLKRAVEETIKRTGAEIDLLAPRIEAIPERSRRLDAVAQAYLARSEDLRARTIVLTASNADRRALNERVREGLIAKGVVQRNSKAATVFVSKDMTAAQVKESSNYRPGDVVRFDRAYRKLGVIAGEYFAVEGVDADSNTILLRGENGRTLGWQPHRQAHVEVFDREGRHLAAGDLIRWTRNDKQKGRRNGTLAEVVSVSDRSAVVRVHGREQQIDLSRDRHWEHAYASTVHAAQGRTADAVIVHVDSSHPQLHGHESWYVGISRAREEVRIYTDDAGRLPAVIQRSMAKTAALEVAIPGPQLGR
jgi:ATP-dependent exoDNAse (exonuclease V) alpha subunit